MITSEASNAQPGESPGRILVADDEATFARPLAAVFGLEGFIADAVFDAASVRAKLREERYEVLISDINMPGNDALELVQEVGTGEYGIPVILLTGAPSIQTAARAVQLGAVAYLLKPIDFSELLPLVRRSVSQYRTRQLARAHRQRLQQWVREVDALEAALTRPESGNPAGDFVARSLNNLLAALLDVKRATELVAAAQQQSNVIWQANTVQALQKSIDVLERTRRNFKSTELRDLRHELQALVEGFRQQGQPPPPST